MTENRSDADKRTWGPLQVMERLATSQSSAVYRARDPVLGRDVALQLFEAGDGDAQRQLLDNGRSLARIRHPNIVQVLGADMHDGVVGVWRELAAGRTLAEIVEHQGPLAVAEVTTIGRQLCAAFAALHDAGLVCQWLDLRNIFREESGAVRLACVGPGADESELAPELSQGASPNPQSDIYALGVLLFRLATGRFPPPGDAGALSEPMIACLSQAISENPGERYATAARFAGALTKAARHPPSRARRIAGIGIILSLAVLVIMQWPSQYRLDTTLFKVAADGSWSELAAGATLNPGDCLRLEVETTVPAYVYVFSEDSQGNARGMFPRSGGAAENPLAADSLHALPTAIAGDSCWKVDESMTLVKIHILTSAEDIPEFVDLYQAVPQLGDSSFAARLLIEAAMELDEGADIAIGVTYKTIELQTPGT